MAVTMTGYRWEMDKWVRQSLDNHVYTCLYEPLDLENVLQVVEEILERKREAR